jgi:predicted Zn-dependent protease
MRSLVLAAGILLAAPAVFAQQNDLQLARQYYSQKAYDKAAAVLDKLYDNTPTDPDVYKLYLESLLGDKNAKKAEGLVRERTKRHIGDELANAIDLGYVYRRTGSDKKADKQWDETLRLLNGDDNLTRRMAILFQEINEPAYALRVYEKAREMTGNPQLYLEEMAILYRKKGDFASATNALLDLVSINPQKLETVQTMLQPMVTDPARLVEIRKAVLKKINQEPDNPMYVDLLVWIYIHQGDYEGAFEQVRALDMRLHDDGSRMYRFAQVCLREDRMAEAINAYRYLIDKGTDKPYYADARIDWLTCRKQQLEESPAYTPQQVNELIADYRKLLAEVPQAKRSKAVRDCAELMALRANQPQEAIALLKEVIRENAADNRFTALCKLDLGDYYILAGDRWESTLLYSQVDKAFREDMLGEEARFRNARLSYFTGDFEWAQSQLTVLKASTSELIANDALNLSVKITENIDWDSNYVPLQTFARADLLIFQHRYAEANATLDSIATQFPKHPLKDDLLMSRAEILIAQQQYPEALQYLDRIVTTYKDDVLADDALYKMALINEEKLKNIPEAKKLYERLVFDFPGSTYLLEARKRVAKLSGTGQVQP